MIRLTFLLTLTLLWSPTAGAQPQTETTGQPDATERARQHFENGQRLVDEGRFANAYTEFERGYELSGRPLFLFNMGECARQMGDDERARRAYERYLEQDPGGQLAATAQQRLAALPRGQPPSRGPTSGPAATAEPPPAAAPKPPLTPPAQEAPPPTPPGLVGLDQPPVPKGPPVWKRWELWAGVGAAVVAGSVVVYATTREGSAGCGAGCIDLRGGRW
jgi:hypothetical protein